jgi:hypothetical protein
MTGVNEIDDFDLRPDDPTGQYQDYDFHRNSSQGDQSCLYGLIRDVGHGCMSMLVLASVQNGGNSPYHDVRDLPQTVHRVAWFR